MEIVVRPALPEDLEDLIQNNLAMALESENVWLDPDIARRGAQKVFDDPSKGFYLTALAEGEIAGSLMVTLEWSDWRALDYWWIQSVYVRPAFRRQGVYSALYNAVLKLAEEKGAPYVRLYVAKENSQAIETYRNTGMEESHYLLFEKNL